MRKGREGSGAAGGEVIYITVSKAYFIVSG